MNMKWYAIIAEIMESIPKSAWQDKSLERTLTLICDAQIESACENQSIAAFEIEEAIMITSRGGDEPGMWHDLRG